MSLKKAGLYTVFSLLSVTAVVAIGTTVFDVPINALTETSAQTGINASQDQQSNTLSTSLATKVNEAKATISSVTSENPIAPPLVLSAREQVGVTVRYDPAYIKLDFPMGDVPIEMGVCTDVVIRAYRQQGKDLQALVNKDMKTAWSAYPKIWGLKGTDKNIDHRRVPNLRVFFKRHGSSLDVSKYKAGNSDLSMNAEDFKAGDMVTWSVSNRPHIGIVSNIRKQGVPLIIHNIGAGTQENDILFRFPITGHYRF